MKRFRDFAQEPNTLDGDKVKIEELFNKEIVIVAYRLMQSKVPTLADKECLQLQFHYVDDETPFITFTNSLVLIKQIKQYESELPFLTTIKKQRQYYTFS